MNGAVSQANVDLIKRKLQARIWIAVSQLDQFQSIAEAELIEMAGLLNHPSMASLKDSESEDLLYQWRWIKSTVDLRAERFAIAEREISQWVAEFDETSYAKREFPRI